MPLDIAYSVCPHDCPSACALAVERVDRAAYRPGARRRGAVLYAGRRLRQGRPLCRAPAPSRAAVGAAAPGRREGQRARRLRPDLLGRRARRGRRAADPGGAAPRLGGRVAAITTPARWGWCSATGINRLRHAMRYSRQNSTICNCADRRRLARRGRREARRRRARDGQVRPDRRLGRQPGIDPGQCDDACRAGAQGARRQARRRRSVPHRHGRTGRHASGAAAGHRRRARLRRHACAVQGGLCRPRLPRALHRRPGRARSPSREPHAGLGGGDHRACRKQQIVEFARLYGAHQAQLSSGSATASRASATARCRCSP